jgi:hypothetical protein
VNVRGIPVYEMPDYLCPRITKQRRTHRKKRINKKWRKRYGWYSYPDPKHLDTMLLLTDPLTGRQSLHVYASRIASVRELIGEQPGRISDRSDIT